MPAPAAIAARATCGFMVSTEIGTSLSARSALIRGTRRSISTSAGTGSAPGRVDSAPISRMSAPSAMSRRACASAASGARKRPPSEKLSGVALTMPMTFGRARVGGETFMRPAVIAPAPRRKKALRRATNEKGGRLRDRPCLYLWPGPLSRFGAGLGRDGHRHGRTGGALGLALVAVGRDALQRIDDLVAGQGLVLEEGLGQGVKVVQLLGQDTARFALAALHQPPDPFVDDLGGLFCDVLVARDRR